jgi:hypothetical protein
MDVFVALLFWPILLSCAHGPTDCTQFNVTVVADANSPTLPHHSVEFSSAVVDSEYIITFTNYYTTDARDGFISAALRPFRNWTIIPRSNPSSEYPSDFSIIQLSSMDREALKALNQHPFIKRVTPQKMLTRILTSGGGKCRNLEMVAILRCCHSETAPCSVVLSVVAHSSLAMLYSDVWTTAMGFGGTVSDSATCILLLSCLSPFLG